MKFAKGGCSRDDEKIACELLMRLSGIDGCVPKYKSVSIWDDDNTTPLMQAVLHSN